MFETIPALKELYRVRLRFKEIFDTARRHTGGRWLRKLRGEAERLGLDLGPFFETYDRWKTEILNYFDARQTSAAVEGINNKARVITKRPASDGRRSSRQPVDALLIPDLNRASEAIGWSIGSRSARWQGVGLRSISRPVLHLKTVKSASSKSVGSRRSACSRRWSPSSSIAPVACDRSYRLIVLRKLLGTDQGQMRLFEEYRYFFYITNDRVTPADQVVFSANDRCDQENLVAGLKSGVYALTTPVEDDLVSNWAYMVMASLAWSLKAWSALMTPLSPRHAAKHQAEKRLLLRMEFATFCAAMIQMPCQIVRSGGRLIYRLL